MKREIGRWRGLGAFAGTLGVLVFGLALGTLEAKEGPVNRRGAAAQPAQPPGLADCRPSPKGDTPWPFCAAQFRLELADGESYLLPGWMGRAQSGQIVFELDLNELPQLANRRRKQWPIYPVMEGYLADQWVNEHGGKKVSLPVIARARIIKDPNTHELRHEVFLEVAPKYPAR